MTLLRSLTLGRYVPGSSPVHRLDPRVKLLCCLLAVTATVWPGRPWTRVAAWPLLAVAAWLSQTPMRCFCHILKPYLWLFGFALLLQAFTTPGSSVWPLPLGTVNLIAERLARGAAVVNQLATAIALSSLLTLTTSPPRLVGAMEWLASPLKRVGLPVGEFCLSLLVAVPLLPILQEEAGRLAGPRGGDAPPRGGVHSREGTFTSSATLLLRQLFAQADALWASRETPEGGPPKRDGGEQRPRVGVAEGVALCLCVATVAGVWLLAVSGGAQ